MSEDTSEQEPTEKPRHQERPFNPLATYAIYTGLVMVGYVLFWLFHYPALIAFTMLFVIILIRDTIHIVKTYEISFARKAAVINLAYSLTFFVVLVVNGLALSRGLPPVIWPEFTELASWSPMFILGGVFGVANIKRMYGPQRTSFSFP
ncbi:MAG: hypothetical protein ACFFE6_12320 [Candidatus Thorarchaeota archaeon]